jgi:hypothetical protein
MKTAAVGPDHRRTLLATATPVPTPYVLQLSNVDGPPVDVLIGDRVVSHLD